MENQGTTNATNVADNIKWVEKHSKVKFVRHRTRLSAIGGGKVSVQSITCLAMVCFLPRVVLSVSEIQ